MKFKIDHDYHIHSKLSLCSRDPEQTPERILDYAKNCGLIKLCLTDHFWDETVKGASDWYSQQNFAHITKSLPLPQSEGIDFYFGCETDLDKHLTLGISAATIEKMDFIIIPTTHLHMRDFTIDGNADNNERAIAFSKRLDGVLDMSLPFGKIGIAHLACNLITKSMDASDVLSLIPDAEYERLFAKAAKKGVGIEINSDDFVFEKKSDAKKYETLRIFAKAKEMGCKFYLGSDAHHPENLEGAIRDFEYAIDQLELTEEDKFRPFG